MLLYHDMSDLISLAERLISEGPHKLEKTPRRVRGLLGGKYIFDTLEARYVWEHVFYPYFYIPLNDFKDVKLEKIIEKKGFTIARLNAGGKSTERVIVFQGGDGLLSELVRVEVTALDAWFVEDTKLLGPHPKDPYKRIETLPSSREIRIELNGIVLAKSAQNVFLFETMLRPRFYLEDTAVVDWGALRESATESFCPYKGMANYYHVDVGGETIEDAVWYYKYPTAESALVAGRLCFYNEKFDVFIDGVKEDRKGPKGHQ